MTHTHIHAHTQGYEKVKFYYALMQMKGFLMALCSGHM